jgi:hypothetical protein
MISRYSCHAWQAFFAGSGRPVLPGQSGQKLKKADLGPARDQAGRPLNAPRDRAAIAAAVAAGRLEDGRAGSGVADLRCQST